MTELTFLARRDITAAPVASSILHEGMHARVHAMCEHSGPRDMAREERLCRRVEFAATPRSFSAAPRAAVAQRFVVDLNWLAA
jgi:hypothetical protein